MFRCVSASVCACVFVCENANVPASTCRAQKEASELLELEVNWLQPGPLQKHQVVSCADPFLPPLRVPLIQNCDSYLSITVTKCPEKMF